MEVTTRIAKQKEYDKQTKWTMYEFGQEEWDSERWVTLPFVYEGLEG